MMVTHAGFRGRRLGAAQDGVGQGVGAVVTVIGAAAAAAATAVWAFIKRPQVVYLVGSVLVKALVHQSVCSLVILINPQ